MRISCGFIVCFLMTLCTANGAAQNASNIVVRREGAGKPMHFHIKPGEVGTVSFEIGHSRSYTLECEYPDSCSLRVKLTLKRELELQGTVPKGAGNPEVYHEVGPEVWSIPEVDSEAVAIEISCADSMLSPVRALVCPKGIIILPALPEPRPIMGVLWATLLYSISRNREPMSLERSLARCIPERQMPLFRSSYDAEAWIVAQKFLNDLGYAVGTADGKAGPRTVSALSGFQAEHGISPSGLLDESTKAALVFAAWPLQQATAQ